MTFEEDNIEHEIIQSVDDKEFYGYDYMIELPNDDKFIKDTLEITYKKGKKGKDIKKIDNKIFIVTEKETFFSFPLYEIVDNKIISFDYKKYQYFLNQGRRFALGRKINKMYNLYAENKIHRKTLKFILNELKLDYPEFFKKYNDKIEEIINKNPKEGK